jgi:hypothetical protein
MRIAPGRSGNTFRRHGLQIWTASGRMPRFWRTFPPPPLCVDFSIAAARPRGEIVDDVDAAMPNAYFAPGRARLAESESSAVRFRCTIEHETQRGGGGDGSGGERGIGTVPG